MYSHAFIFWRHLNFVEHYQSGVSTKSTRSRGHPLQANTKSRKIGSVSRDVVCAFRGITGKIRGSIRVCGDDWV